MSDPLAPLKDAATALAEGLGLPSGLRNFSVLALALADPATGLPVTAMGIGGAVMGGAANRVLFEDGTGKLKDASGFTFDGTTLSAPAMASRTPLVLGVSGSVVGSIDFKNATSGTASLAPPTGPLGTYTVTLPGAAGTLLLSTGSGTGLTWVSVPATAGAAGVANQVAFDGNYIYRCIDTNTWVRAPLTYATW